MTGEQVEHHKIINGWQHSWHGNFYTKMACRKARELWELYQNGSAAIELECTTPSRFVAGATEYHFRDCGMGSYIVVVA
jgi:hypothetical protein